MRKNFIILTGIPGSGKSSWAKDFAKRSKDFYAYVSSDEMRGMLTGNEGDISKDGVIWGVLYKTLDVLLTKNVNIIFDATSYNKKARRKLFNIVEKFDYTVEAMVFDTPLEVCLRRNQERTRKVPENVIQYMYDMFEYPEFSEGFSAINRLSYPATRINNFDPDGR